MMRRFFSRRFIEFWRGLIGHCPVCGSKRKSVDVTMHLGVPMRCIRCSECFARRKFRNLNDDVLKQLDKIRESEAVHEAQSQ